MKLQDDFTTLNWVKGELDETLKQARQALEAYVDDPADASLMRFCATYLHQAQGTLRMVELYGAAMVIEEMERLAEALLGDRVKQREEGYSVLMRGMVQLPDYLERVQSGHKDIPIVLLPLLNDLRACRGEKLLTESVLFSPNLSAPLPPAADGVGAPLEIKDVRARTLRLRLAFQASLLKWIRDSTSIEHPARLRDVLDRLRSTVAHGEDPRRLFWIAAAAADAVSDGGLEASAAVKLLFGGIDREIRHYAEKGEEGLRAAPPRELVQNLLYYVAHSTSSSERIEEIRRTYKLSSLLPTDQEVAHAQGSMAGHNRTLLDTVSTAIKDDLVRVKEALDIFLRSQQRDPADLLAQVEVLDRVRDTLGMLGLGVPRRVVTEQRATIEEISNGRRSADEGTLLDVAGALLYVEASLDDHIERLGAVSENTEQSELDLPKAEVRKILDALMREAAINIQQAKHDVVAFIESPWDHARVEQIPRLLEEISGALRMLDLGSAAELMGGIVGFVEVELIRHHRVPTTEQMDKLADALASIEYFLEATREQRGGRERILDVTRSSLESLGYWPVPVDSDGGDDGGGGGHDGAGGGPPPVAQDSAADALRAAAELAYSDEPGTDTQSFAQTREIPPIVDEALDMTSEFPSWGENVPLESSVAFRPDDASGSREINLDGLTFGDLTDEAAPVAEEKRTGPLYELDSAVEIAPGADLGDLIIGESGAVRATEQDLAGLRLAETTHDREPGSDTDATQDAVVEPVAERWIEIEEEYEEEVEVDAQGDVAPTAFEGGFQISASSEIDDEIRDVFIEEVQEEIDNLRQQLPVWQANAENMESLKPIRRSFHTLKGSGRLVGAMALGEFSWKVENMLNRVLDRTIQPTPQARALVEHAIAALPGLLDALRGEGSPDTMIAAIMDTADRLAAGESVWLTERSAEPRRTIKRMAKRLVRVPAPALDESVAHDRAATPAVQFVEKSVDEIVAGPLPGLDPVLFDILKSETAMHLAAVDEFLEQSRFVPLPVSESLLRAVHTLSGAIAMVEIGALSQVLAPLEGYLKRARAQAMPIGADGIAVLGESAELVREVMRRLDSGSSDLPDSTVLSARVGSLRDALAEPLSALELYHQDEDVAAEEVAAGGLDDLADQPSADVAFAESVNEDSTVQVGEPDSFEFNDADLTARLIDQFSEAPAEPGAVDALATDAAHEPVSAAPLTGEPADEADWLIELSEVELSPGDAFADEGETLSPVAGVGSEPETVADMHAPLETAEAEATVITSTSDEQIGSTDGDSGFEDLHDLTLGSSESAPVAETSRPDPPAPAVVAPPRPRMLPDDIQPDGRLELPEIDEDLLDIFVIEGNDILDHADAMIAQLRESPHDRELVATLQRDLHTLKGGARMAGLAPIGDLSHAMESLLDVVYDGIHPMDRVAVESLEHGFDDLHGLVQRVSRRQAIAMPVNAIARFESIVSGVLDEPAAAVAESGDIVASEPAQTARPAPRAMPAPELDDEPRAPQEMIRVRSDLLDSLVNYAGEVSIYRSRLEQQISTFRFNLVEFEQTVARLREQLRKLEIETEAQIIARYQREHHEGADVTFDPLELDRFSQLQQYSRALSESVSDLVSIQGLLDDLTRQSETLLLQQSRVSSDLQEGLMRTRMVPFDSLVPSLRRTLRQAAQELDKRAQLKVEGAQGEMDRNLLERMKAPFEHMLRNALAHGIEKPEQRLAANKPLDGTVTIAVSREATEVVLRITDDGRGLDRDAIRNKAIAQGLLSPEAQLSDRDLYGFIMEAGFSTAEHITQISGRGVGMDVVHSEIKQLGGSLAIDSTHGQGTIFTIRLPFTLAVTQAILVKLGDSTYAVPMSSVQGVVRIAQDDYARRISSGSPTYSYAGDEFTIYEMSQLLGVPQGRMLDETQLPLLMTRAGDQRAAVRIDGVVGSREIVVKSVGPQISSVPGIFGATIMGDGSVVMILDLAPLVRRSAALRASAAAGEIELPQEPVVDVTLEKRRNPLIMVVDDSITMRKVTTRVLERADMDVITAKDGLDAVEKLQDNVPDLMLLDIEMPRMDGYELATYMRNDARLKRVPIIMVTSRTGEKHRQRALEIGVERYLGKPYQEVDLLRQVQETLRTRRVEQ